MEGVDDLASGVDVQTVPLGFLQEIDCDQGVVRLDLLQGDMYPMAVWRELWSSLS